MPGQEAMFQEVLASIERGDKAYARELLTLLLKDDPKNSRYWLWMSSAVETDRERVYCLKQVLRFDPSNQEAQLGLKLKSATPPQTTSKMLPNCEGNALIRLKKVGSKAVRFLLSLDRRQKAAAALALLAVLVLITWGLIRLVRPKPVVGNLQSLATYGPSATLAPTQTEVATQTIVFPKEPVPLSLLLKATYTPTPPVVNTPHPLSEAYKMALRAYQKSEWASALNYFDQALRLEPDAPDLYYHKGEIYRLKGEYDAALKWYQLALSKANNFAPALVGQARALLGKNPKNSADAQKALEAALGLQSHLVEARLELAKLFESRGDGQAALDVLAPEEDALLDSPIFFELRARAHQQTGSSDQALADARRCTELDFTCLPCYLLIGEALVSTGRAAEAVEPLEIYTRYVKKNRPLIWLAAGYVEQGKPDQAVDALTQAVEAAPDDSEAYLQRGLIYLASGQVEKAIADLEAAQSLSPRSFSAQISLGRAYLEAGKYDSAYTRFSRAEGLALTLEEKSEVFFCRALALESLNRVKDAIRDWQKLLALPAGASRPEWIETAKNHLSNLATVTPTVKPDLTQPVPQASQPVTTP